MMQHRITKIADQIWCFNELAVQAFLVVGTQRAALLDTGDGMGDLVREVREVTDKPLYVLNTHGHVDHAGGNSQFPLVYLSEKDFLASEDMCTYEKRKWYAETRIGRFSPEHLEEAVASLIPDRPYGRVAIKEGMTFDLGGCSLEVIETPGHTAGSLCFLDGVHGLLFTGDMANASTIVYKKNQFYGCTVETYHKSMEKLWKLQGYDQVVCGHGTPLQGREQVEKLLRLTGNILDGTLAGKKDTVGIRDGVCYRMQEQIPGVEFWCDGDNIFDQ